jgi:hypothetical protein
VEPGDHDTRVGADAVLVDERERILLALWNEGETPAWTLPAVRRGGRDGGAGSGARGP